MKKKSAARLDAEIAEALARSGSKYPRERDAQLPLGDAALAVKIAAIRDQISQLCSDLRYDFRDKPQAVLTHLDDVQHELNEALGVVLTVEKSS
jgi:hypothetical protein